MMKILGLIVAYDEIITLPAAVASFRDRSIPYIAVLDCPTPEVRWILRHALDTFETPKVEPHVYRWQTILDLMEWAAKRPREYDWIWRIDADELWPDIRGEIEAAEKAGQTIINFGICNYVPELKTLGPDQNFIDHCRPAKRGDRLWLQERYRGPGDGNLYHRAWSLRKPWNFYGGGHMINHSGNPKIGHNALLDSQKNEIRESPLIFRHYPAVSEEALIQKINRNYLKSEKDQGWHNHYDTCKQKIAVMAAPVACRPPKIHIFYHIGMMYNWKDIMADQMGHLRQADLLFNKNLTVGYNSDYPTDFSNGWAQRCVYGGPLCNYEFPTLKLLYNYCHENPNDYVLYFHTKGVSHPGFRHHAPWRNYMMYWVIEKWGQCVKDLATYDAVGCEWTDGKDLCKYGCVSPMPHGFFGGNFWWAKASYINTLPDPNTLDRSNRYYAEAWIGLAPTHPHIKCYHDTRKSYDGNRGWSMYVHGWSRAEYEGIDHNIILP